MSALGQKSTYALQQVMSALHPIATAKAKFRKMAMSALPPKADMCDAAMDVRFGPIADIVLSVVSMWLDARHQNRLAGHLKPHAPFIRSERFDQFFHNPLAYFRFLKLND